MNWKETNSAKINILFKLNLNTELKRNKGAPELGRQKT